MTVCAACCTPKAPPPHRRSVSFSDVDTIDVVEPANEWPDAERRGSGGRGYQQLGFVAVLMCRQRAGDFRILVDCGNPSWNPRCYVTKAAARDTGIQHFHVILAAQAPKARRSADRQDQSKRQAHASSPKQQ